MHIWLRSEQRAHEKRSGLTPSGARDLINAGFKLTVEESATRIFPIDAYRDAGCAIAPAHTWPSAPAEAVIFGLKELDEDGPDLPHRHIHFGHAFKGQTTAPALLSRFKRGGGTLYDLEYLTHADGRRVAAFGYWAGFAGAAVGVKAWVAQQAGEALGAVGDYPGRDAFIDELSAALGACDPTARADLDALIIGALGRVGSGAVELFDTLGIATTKWDMAETAHGGPFPEIAQHTFFVNCILATQGVPVFFPASDVAKARKLRVIADVACDPDSAYNPIPVYDHSTSFADPIIRVAKAPNRLDVMAIDNLPSMLPLESSEDYAAQLLPHLLTLETDTDGVWDRAEKTFNQHLSKV